MYMLKMAYNIIVLWWGKDVLKETELRRGRLDFS